jgi:hypothetical protein
MRANAPRGTTMTAKLLMIGVGMLALSASGCGSSGHGTANGAQTGEQKDSGPRAPVDAGGNQVQELAGYDWTAGPGEEKYWCGYKTLTDDLYISEFRPVMPNGTHHVVIGYYESPTQPDGTFPEGTNGCIGVTFGDIYTYVGTVGAHDLPLPDGVAVKIPAGSQVVFGLHVLNTGTDPSSGHAGVEIVEPDASKVANEAEVIAVSNFGIAVPPGKVTQTVDCTMVADATVFAVMPHMHLMGKHMTTTTVTANGPGPTLLDQDYVFTEQEYKQLSPTVKLAKGDKIHVECDYENTSNKTLTFGESTNNGEMCITFAYRYPAVSATLPVTSGFPRGNCFDPPPATP